MYQRRPDGSLQFNGRRPGPDWHAHGYFTKNLLFWEDERLVLRQVHKRRWRQTKTHQTCHSRPPHDPPYIRVSTPLIVLVLCLAVAISVMCDANADVQICRSARTIQRWRARARSVGLYLQHAIRHALIEICEPRPVESLFEGGLSPPSPTSSPKPSETSDDVKLRRGLWMAQPPGRGSREVDRPQINLSVVSEPIRATGMGRYPFVRVLASPCVQNDPTKVVSVSVDGPARLRSARRLTVEQGPMNGRS